MRSRIGTVLARHGIPGKLFGTIRGGGALVGGLAHALKGSVSSGAVFAGSLSLRMALAGTIAGAGAFVGNLTAASPVALDLPFSTMSSGADLTAKGVTFTRSGLATQYDSTGKLTWAPNNIWVQSNDFVAGWNNNSSTLTANAGTAPDGSNTAWSFITTNRLYQFDNSGVIGRKIFSIYAKAAAGSTFTVVPTGSVQPDVGVTFNLATGAATSGGSMLDVGNGWYRCFIPCSITLASGNSTFWQVNGASSAILIWGVQYEAVTYQTTPRPYVATTSAAYYGPRFDYDPVTLQPKGLLIEESRTNLLTYSDQFDNGVWTPLAATVAADAVIAPNGTLTADKLAYTATANWHLIRNVNITLTTSAAYTLSVYAKAAEETKLALTDMSGSTGVVFDLSAITAGAVTGSDAGLAVSNPTITDVGGGWRRCSIVMVASATGRIPAIYLRQYAASFTATAGDGLYVWGAQLEVGAFPASYIPTTSASVTRAAETASMTGTNFSSWYNQSEGTFVVDVIPPAADELGAVMVANTTIYNDSHSIWKSNAGINAAGNYWASQIIASGLNIQSLLLSASGAASSPSKIAHTYKVNDVNAAVNGVANTADTSAVMPSPTNLRIGGRDDGYTFNGHIKSLTYYNTRKSNAELQLLTVPTVLASASIIASGDSTIAAYLGYNSVASYLSAVTATDIAVPGQTIAQQNAAWNGLGTYTGYNAVVVEIGLNDLDPAETAATALARLQAYVNKINADKPAATKLVIGQMLPCRQRLIDLYGGTNGPVSYQKWLDMNDAIAGNGVNAISGVDGRVTSHVAILNDGSGNLGAEFDYGDHIHENNTARQIIADAWRAKLGQVIGLTSDATPAAFAFTDATSVAASTVVTSDPIRVVGIDTSATISVTGGAYSKNGGAFTSSPGSVVSGDIIAAQGTSSATGGATVNVAVTIGGVSDTFSITTQVAVVLATLNPSDKAADATLSNGNLTVTSATANADVRATRSAATGKKFFSIHADTLTVSDYIMVGLAKSTFGLTTIVGTNTDAVGYWSHSGASSAVFLNNANLLTMPNWAAGDVIDVAVDLDARRMWVRKNGGAWNDNAGSHDPATALGGIDISALTGTLYPILGLYTAGVAATANFGATSYTYAAPSGFGNW